MMIKFAKFAAVTSTVLLCFTASLWLIPNQASAINVVEINDETTGQVNVGRSDILVVSLRESPTTGYRWIFFDKPSFKMRYLGESYLSDYQAGKNFAHVGGGGVHRFVFMPVDLDKPTLDSDLAFILYGPQSRFAPVKQLNFQVRVSFD
jgi:predicted secreted protein